MRIRHSLLFLLLFVTSLSIVATPAAAGHGSAGGPANPALTDGDTINISGVILDSHSEPVEEAEVTVLVDGEVMDRGVTAHNGHYVSRFQMKKDKILN